MVSLACGSLSGIASLTGAIKFDFGATHLAWVQKCRLVTIPFDLNPSNFKTLKEPLAILLSGELVAGGSTSGLNMFNLSKMEHTLRLQPHLLSLPLNEAVKGELESLFLDKVIANLGLCISVYDIESIDGGFVFANEGAPTYTVKFRLIMFRPFVGEIISARLKESNADGLRLSLGFFDDIYIPELLMPEPSRAEPDPETKNQVKWIWTFNDEEYPIDGYDEIRFRVQNIKFPEIPKEQKESKPFAPMEIIGSLVSEGGLGPISWWV